MLGAHAYLPAVVRSYLTAISTSFIYTPELKHTFHSFSSTFYTYIHNLIVRDLNNISNNVFSRYPQEVQSSHLRQARRDQHKNRRTRHTHPGTRRSPHQPNSLGRLSQRHGHHDKLLESTPSPHPTRSSRWP